MVDLNHRLLIDGAVGLVGIATTSTAFSRMAHTMNSMGGGVWKKLGDDNDMSLLELGIHSSVVIRTLSLCMCTLFYFHVHIYSDI